MYIHNIYDSIINIKTPTLTCTTVHEPIIRRKTTQKEGQSHAMIVICLMFCVITRTILLNTKYRYLSFVFNIFSFLCFYLQFLAHFVIKMRYYMRIYVPGRQADREGGCGDFSIIRPFVCMLYTYVCVYSSVSLLARVCVYVQ